MRHTVFQLFDGSEKMPYSGCCFLSFRFDDYDDTSQENVMVCKRAVIELGRGGKLLTREIDVRERLCICHIELLCIRLIVRAVGVFFYIYFFAT